MLLALHPVYTNTHAHTHTHRGKEIYCEGERERERERCTSGYDRYHVAAQQSICASLGQITSNLLQLSIPNFFSQLKDSVIILQLKTEEMLTRASPKKKTNRIQIMHQEEKMKQGRC